MGCVLLQPKTPMTNDEQGLFFKGEIWVETFDFTIIQHQGIYVSASHSNPSLAVNNCFNFDSRRVELVQHLWLPSAILPYNDRKHGDIYFPEFKVDTTFLDYKSHWSVVLNDYR